MNNIIVDLKDVMKMGRVWNIFSDAFDFPKPYTIPDDADWFSWDAFWDWFSVKIEELSKMDTVHLIVRNASKLKKISRKGQAEYDQLIHCLTDASNVDRLKKDHALIPGSRFTYELIEDIQV